MSYRLISSNDIAIKYPEVNDMPCIYADLPNGMDGEHYVLEQEPKTGHWIEDTNGTYTDNHDTWECSECGHAQILLEGTPKDNDYNYCPNCGAKMIEPQERSKE